jgi:antitoxin component of RelBE/YafQ-DinJ toxin-antitoxin module
VPTPSNKQLVAFKIDRTLLRRLDEACRQLGIPRSIVIRQSLYRFLGMTALEMSVSDRVVLNQQVQQTVQAVQPAKAAVSDDAHHSANLEYLKKFDPAYVGSPGELEIT